MNLKYENISAIVLAGGESKRIGRNKALLKVNNKTIIEIVLNKLKNLFTNILISTNNNTEYSFLRYSTINDILKNHGPLSGIHSGLAHSNTQKNFFISCDMPLIDEHSISYIVENSNNAEITIPIVENYPIYVCGVYSKNILNEIEKMIGEQPQKASIKNLTKKVETKYLDIKLQSFFNEINYLNMNTNQDYEIVKNILKSESNE